jgi:tRNA dimethylallyltransferase
MTSKPRPRALVITGETGTGKSALALELATRLNGAIINADSLSFYRGFDIGTAKPTLQERAQAPHHLIDILDPPEHFDAHAFLEKARPLVESLWERGVVPLVVGGTGLYIRSLSRGLFHGPGPDPAFREELRRLEAGGMALHDVLGERDPLAASRISPRDRVRIERALEVLHLTGESIVALQGRHALNDSPFLTLDLVVTMDKDALERRLKERVGGMFAAGLAEETRALLQAFPDPSLKPFQAIGYKETVAYLQGGISLEETQEKVFLNTRRLAKRQRTWLRGQLPGGTRVPPGYGPALELAKVFLGGGG